MQYRSTKWEVAQYILPLRAITEIIRLAEERREFSLQKVYSFQWEDISLFLVLLKENTLIIKSYSPELCYRHLFLGMNLEKLWRECHWLLLLRVSGRTPAWRRKIELSSSGEVGIAKESEADRRGRNKNIFNARYLLDTLRSFSGEKAMLEISGNLLDEVERKMSICSIF